MNIYNNTEIIKIFNQPTSEKEFNDWLELKNVIPFLERELNDEYIILHAISNHLFLNSILIPNIQFGDQIIEDMLEWSGNSFTTWSIWKSSSSYELYEPKSPLKYDIGLDSEQIIFGREFEGVKGYECYYEINQKIFHALGLHFIPERKAWCKLDSNGDIDESIKEININLSKNDAIKLICINKELFSKYTSATNQILLRMIDCHAFGDDFYGWSDDRKYVDINTGITYGQIGYNLPIGSYFRGIQLINLDKVSLMLLGKEDDANLEYVELICNDIKYNKVITVSCNPNELDNYFIDRGKPWEMSPAFFNAEVLRKYKSDTEKYTIKDRSIECRGTWYLRSFDINDVGQISVYLVDFNKLPYKEQLHWKQYNEKPKAFISKRAIETDFEGKFTNEILPLVRLKHLLTQMERNNLNWWKLRNKENLDKLQYPLTPSKDEWAEELLIFDQVVIEGLEEKWLRHKAKELNSDIENRYRALKLIECILISKGFEKEHAYEIMSVFHEIHNLRSEVKGHSSGDTAEQRKKETIIKYGSYKAHFDSLASRMYDSLQILLDELN